MLRLTFDTNKKQWWISVGCNFHNFKVIYMLQKENGAITFIVLIMNSSYVGSIKHLLKLLGSFTTPEGKITNTIWLGINGTSHLLGIVSMTLPLKKFSVRNAMYQIFIVMKGYCLTMSMLFSFAWKRGVRHGGSLSTLLLKDLNVLDGNMEQRVALWSKRAKGPTSLSLCHNIFIIKVKQNVLCLYELLFQADWAEDLTLNSCQTWA